MMHLSMKPPESHNHPRIAIALVWGLPYAALLDTAIASMLQGWRPYGTIEFTLLGILGLWSASAIVLLHTATRHRLARLWRELLLLAMIGVVGWPILELTAYRVEATLRPRAPFHTRGINIHNTFTPDPIYLPGIQGSSHFTTGPDGLRAPTPPEPGQVRVICVGGSTTECVYLDDSETWAALLPQYLAPELSPTVWVGNAGISGFDTQDHLRFVERSPLLNDTAALVIQPGINDLWRYLAKEVQHMDYNRFAGELNDSALPTRDLYRPVWTRSHLIQLYHTWRRPPPPPEQREGVGGLEYEIRREKRRIAETVEELPSLDAGLEAYRARISGIINASRARGVPVLFTTQAVLWRATSIPS